MASISFDLSLFRDLHRWTSLSLTVDELWGDLGNAGEHVTLYVGSFSTGVMCTTKSACGGGVNTLSAGGNHSPVVLFLAKKLKASMLPSHSPSYHQISVLPGTTFQALWWRAQRTSPFRSSRPLLQLRAPLLSGLRLCLGFGTLSRRLQRVSPR